MRRGGILALFCVALSAAGPTGQVSEIAFDRYDALSSNRVMAERLLPPVIADLALRGVAAQHKGLRDQPVDLAKEQFRIFVPVQQPPKGYGLLVFVPPWQQAMIPSEWLRVLDRKGMIMVTPARSGNAESVLGRRDPLALLAATNTMARYRVDPARVYIGGFSGGSKVAFKLAVGYPDLFKGALLLAGADPLGEDGFTVPSRELWLGMQRESRIVLVAGKRDEINDTQANNAAISLREFCLRASARISVPDLGHELVGSGTLLRALNALDGPAPQAVGDREKCQAELDSHIASELSAIDAMAVSGRKVEARKRLLQLDARFGGLALPGSLALLRRIEVD